MKPVARRGTATGLAIGTALSACQGAMALDDVPRPPLPPTSHVYIKPPPVPPRPPKPIPHAPCIARVHAGAEAFNDVNEVAGAPPRMESMTKWIGRIKPGDQFGPLLGVIRDVDGRAWVWRTHEYAYHPADVDFIGDCAEAKADLRKSAPR